MAMKTSPSDITITRASINKENALRIAQGKEPLMTAESIVKNFIAIPHHRHFARAIRLGFPSKP